MFINKTYKEIFTNCLRESLKARWSDAFLKELEGGGFFESPCSTQYHLPYAGGLVEHSVNVAYLCKDLGSFLGYEDEKLDSLVVAGLLHDVGKMGQFGKANYVENILKSVKEYTAGRLICLL